MELLEELCIIFSSESEPLSGFFAIPKSELVSFCEGLEASTG